MLVSDFGRWRKDLAHKKSRATGSCAAKASAVLCGVRTADGWSVAEAMVL